MIGTVVIVGVLATTCKQIQKRGWGEMQRELECDGSCCLEQLLVDLFFQCCLGQVLAGELLWLSQYDQVSCVVGENRPDKISIWKFYFREGIYAKNEAVCSFCSFLFLNYQRKMPTMPMYNPETYTYCSRSLDETCLTASKSLTPLQWLHARAEEVFQRKEWHLKQKACANKENRKACKTQKIKCKQEMKRTKLDSSSVLQRVVKLLGRSYLNVLQVGSQEENWQELFLTMEKMADAQ